MLKESNHELKKSQKELAEILPAYASQIENALCQKFGNGKPELQTSSYLLPDGKLINSGGESHSNAHNLAIEVLPREIQEYIGIIDAEDEENDDGDWFDAVECNIASVLVLAMPGTIRLNSAHSHCYIGLSGPITAAQQKVLVAWLDLVHDEAADNGDNIELWYEDLTTSSQIRKFDPHEYSVDELLKVIKYLANAKKFSHLYEETAEEESPKKEKGNE